MFDNLLSFWKGKDFLKEVLGEFERMLNDTEDMFKKVCKKLLEGQADEDLKDRIYKIDREVNRIEKEIRKRIVTHLSIQGNVDLPASLILMSVVKDAERLGDYSKNLFEVTELLNEPLDKKIFKDLFGNLDERIIKEFSQTRAAFIKSNTENARDVLRLEREIVKECDEIISKLSKSSFQTNVAVCLTLVARYFKRTAAHLANIASSVVLPISDLDFFDEKIRHKNENGKY